MRIEKARVFRIHLEWSETVLLVGMCKVVARTKLADASTKEFAQKLLVNIAVPDRGEDHGREDSSSSGESR